MFFLKHSHTHTSKLTLMPQWESEPLQTPDLTDLPDSITNSCHVLRVCTCVLEGVCLHLCLRVCAFTHAYLPDCLLLSVSGRATLCLLTWLQSAWARTRVIHMTDESWRCSPLVGEKNICSSGHVVFSADKNFIKAIMGILQRQEQLWTLSLSHSLSVFVCV